MQDNSSRSTQCLSSRSLKLILLGLFALVLISIGIPRLGSQRRTAGLVTPALINSPSRFRLPAHLDDSANTTAMLLLTNLSQREKQRALVTQVAGGQLRLGRLEGIELR